MQQRRQRIVQIINREGQVTFSALKAQFPDISEMTLRTDLKCLDEAGEIIRIHGGARSIETVAGTDGPLSQRMIRNAPQKQEIAAKAVELLRSHGSVFIDSGSTTTAMCRMIPDEPRIIYTTGVSCATELCALSKPMVYLPGGQLNRYSVSITGSQVISDLQSCHFNICFLGVLSFSPEYGFCSESKDDGLLKTVVIQRSDLVVALMDSSKYGLVNTHCFASVEDVDVVISDGLLTDEQRDFFVKHGVTVL